MSTKLLREKLIELYEKQKHLYKTWDNFIADKIYNKISNMIDDELKGTNMTHGYYIHPLTHDKLKGINITHEYHMSPGDTSLNLADMARSMDIEKAWKLGMFLQEPSKEEFAEFKRKKKSDKKKSKKKSHRAKLGGGKTKKKRR